MVYNSFKYECRAIEFDKLGGDLKMSEKKSLFEVIKENMVNGELPGDFSLPREEAGAKSQLTGQVESATAPASDTEAE